MMSIEQLLKLANRRRHYKLVQEGIAYILVHSIQTEGTRIFDNLGRMMLYDDPFFSLTLYSTGYIQRQMKKDNSIEQVPAHECKFERLASHIVDRIARHIGDCLYLFVPKERLTPTMILRCQNSAVQSRLIEIFGEKEFFSAIKSHILHQDGTSELLCVQLTGVEELPVPPSTGGSFRVRRHMRHRLVMVKVIDPSTKKTYLLRVPPTTRTCKEAVAWTFGMKKDEYNPVKEN